MRLPSGELAFIDICKLTEYCLNPGHEDGQHKSRVFRSAGITLETVNQLFEALQQAAANGEATLGKLDCYGQRYLVDFEFQGGERRAMIRSAWIIRTAESVPRLVTCYIL